MSRSATEIMHDVIVAAMIDGVGALRAASKGVPNALLRDLNAIHPNTTFQDLPADLQASIQASVRTAFTKLAAEGYTVLNPKIAATPRPQPKPGTPVGRGDGRPRDPRGPGDSRGPRPPGSKPGGARPGGTKPGGTKPGSGRRPPSR